jgi:hypothetical protein
MNMKYLALCMLFLSATAFADERRMLPLSPAEEWRMECTTCHMAYPPRMLPAASWRKMMTNLDKHFGSDASLDDLEVRKITRYLEANAAKNWRGAVPDRISETPHFKREHRRIAADVIQRPAIRSLGNCVACHAGAEKGDFEEDRVRIPR